MCIYLYTESARRHFNENNLRFWYKRESAEYAECSCCYESNNRLPNIWCKCNDRSQSGHLFSVTC